MCVFVVSLKVKIHAKAKHLKNLIRIYHEFLIVSLLKQVAALG